MKRAGLSRRRQVGVPGPAGCSLSRRAPLKPIRPLLLAPPLLPQHLVIAAVGGTCKLFLQAGARTSVQGGERMAAALRRPPGQGLITVSNHVGSIDDPLITSSSECSARLCLFPVDKLGPMFGPAAGGGHAERLPSVAKASRAPRACRQRWPVA